MKSLSYIYDDDTGCCCFDRYFEYLQSIKNELPEPLATFALDEERYMLNGDKTLHDGWLLSLNMSKSIDFGYMASTDVKLALLQAMHKKIIYINYLGVQTVNCSLADSNVNAPADLLVHEFSKVNNKMFRHFIKFYHEVWIEILFSSFCFHEEPYHSDKQA